MHAPFGLVMAINTMSHISKAYCNRSSKCFITNARSIFLICLLRLSKRGNNKEIILSA
ncbi:unnamed protein product [Brassica oleracea]